VTNNEGSEFEMTLTELKNAIETSLKFERNPDNINVVISTALPYATYCQRPCEDVRYAGMGFDWEAGQFRIEPKEKLMAVKHDVPQMVMEYRNNYHCPKCEHMLSGKRKNTDIRFCSRCGQAVKWE